MHYISCKGPAVESQFSCRYDNFRRVDRCSVRSSCRCGRGWGGALHLWPLLYVWKVSL